MQAALSRQSLDGPLFVGSTIFGIGWGLAGICPGPTLVQLRRGYREAAVLVASMIPGDGERRGPKEGSLVESCDVVVQEHRRVSDGVPRVFGRTLRACPGLIAPVPFERRFYFGAVFGPGHKICSK
jgi:hypothetical protein